MYQILLSLILFMTHSLIQQDITKPHIIIVDIDWTVAHKWSRSPYNYSKVIEDTPYNDIIRILSMLSKSYEIWFVTGRPESCRQDTSQWLRTHIPFKCSFLAMRATWDKRPDNIIKHEIAQDIALEYYIFAVFDDRDRVVKMWREAWIRCLQVQEWDF